jgi:hypothetical protein
MKMSRYLVGPVPNKQIDVKAVAQALRGRGAKIIKSYGPRSNPHTFLVEMTAEKLEGLRACYRDTLLIEPDEALDIG